MQCNMVHFKSQVWSTEKKSKILLTVILWSKAYSDTSLSDRYKRLSLVVIGIRCTFGTLFLDSTYRFPSICDRERNRNIGSHTTCKKGQYVFRN